VPSLWWYEIANALLMPQKRNRISEADRVRLVSLYGLLPVQTDTALYPEVVSRFQELALTHALTAYDAAYLELALRKGLPLATFDRKLKKAAEEGGVGVILA
jgi:predicted nucleic acid-binding protein